MIADRPEAPRRADRAFCEYLFRHLRPYDRLCGKASYRLSRKGGRLTLTTSLPLTAGEKEWMLELTDDVTGRFSFGPGLESGRQAQRALLTDELTGLYNRRFIDRALSEALARPGEPFALLMADIDRFKSVNDIFGHVAGDRALRRFAGLLLGQIRKGHDWAARYGGEEFLICLKEAEREPVFRAAERIRLAVMRHGFPCGENVIRLTCSIGVCRVSAGSPGRSAEGLIEAADQALYRAKEAGRNRVAME